MKSTCLICDKSKQAAKNDNAKLKKLFFMQHLQFSLNLRQKILKKNFC